MICLCPCTCHALFPFFPPLLTSTYTTTKCTWGFERNQLQNECKYKKVVPTPPFCTKRPLAGILYCSPSPPLYVAKIWRRIHLSGIWGPVVIEECGKSTGMCVSKWSGDARYGDVTRVKLRNMVIEATKVLWERLNPQSFTIPNQILQMFCGWSPTMSEIINHYPLVIQRSYGKWPTYRWLMMTYLLLNMVSFQFATLNHQRVLTIIIKGPDNPTCQLLPTSSKQVWKWDRERNEMAGRQVVWKNCMW